MLAKVLGVIGARLNSSRLPGKHLLNLAGKPLIARLFERLEQIPELNRLVLATTDDAYNTPLVEWARNNDKSVFAYSGEVNDLVARVDALVQSEQPDIIVYFCGDSPLIEPQTVSKLIRGLQDQSGDLVELEGSRHGSKYIHEGFSVYRRSVWDRIVAEAQRPEEREHVGASLARFQDQLSITRVPENSVFSSVDHRISVDTSSDYQFMSEVYHRWYAAHAPDTLVSLRWVVEQLKQDATLADINSHVRQKAVGDSSKGALIVCHAGPGIGLGHLTRSLVAARALQDKVCYGVRLLIQGEPVARNDLPLIPHRYVSLQEPLSAAILDEVHAKQTDIVIFDIHPQLIPSDLVPAMGTLRKNGVRLVAIDSPLTFLNEIDLGVIPSFFFDPPKTAHWSHRVLHGWDYYLLGTPKGVIPWSPGNKVLVLTGGGDAAHLGRRLPRELDRDLPTGSEIHWVRGPYSEQPQLPERLRLAWAVHQAPSGLGTLMAQSSYSLTVYGVSFFELLQYGIPTVVFSPYGEKDRAELECLRQQDVAVVATDGHHAVAALRDLMSNMTVAEAMSRRAASKIDGQGALRFAEQIKALVGRP